MKRAKKPIRTNIQYGTYYAEGVERWLRDRLESKEAAERAARKAVRQQPVETAGRTDRTDAVAP